MKLYTKFEFFEIKMINIENIDLQSQSIYIGKNNLKNPILEDVMVQVACK